MVTPGQISQAMQGTSAISNNVPNLFDLEYVDYQNVL